MMLQALYQLAQTENLMADPDYEPKPVAWLVRVDRDGKLLGIEGTHYLPPQEGKKKPKPIAKKFSVPKQPTGRSGTKAPPCFLVDNAKYVFGLPTKDKGFPEQEGREKSSWFRELIAQCVEATRDEGATAVLALLDEVAEGKQTVTLPERCVSNDLFAFVFAPDIDLLVHQRPKVRDHWKAQREEPPPSETAKVQCLVSGRWFEEVGLFPLIEKVPGGSPSRIGLVSFNKRAFESYGWSGNENAPISRDAAEACATALNRLLDPAYPHPAHPERTMPKRHLRLTGDTAVCYWGAGKSADDLMGVFGALFDANPEEVAEMYRSIWRGKPPDIADTSAFYALTITGTQGRAIVRDWFESTVAEVARNLAVHFADLDIVRNTPNPKEKDLPPHFPLGLLVESLAIRGKRDEIPDHLASELVRAALAGTPYSFSLLQRALERTRAEIGGSEWADLARRDARAALIKAVLNRRKRFSNTYSGYTEVQRDMDTNNMSPGYRLGRLMAVMERMQQAALGDKVNASVVDRFFSGASATPGVVFPRLLKNLRHHASKAKDDPKTRSTAHWLDGQLDEILAPLAGFPSYLDIEQQGLFVLGYHHQRKYIWTKREARNDKANAEITTEE
jgi:CRISPR-associated protein Csd1